MKDKKIFKKIVGILREKTAIIGTLICSILLVTSFTILLLNSQVVDAKAQSKEKWTDFAADKFAGGNGSVKSPYKISSATQLALLSKLVETGASNEEGIKYSQLNYKLMKNITLNYWNDSNSDGIVNENELYYNKDNEVVREWTPIGNEINQFQGNFDGNGCYVAGIYITTGGNNGLFGYVSGTYNEESPSDESSWTTGRIINLLLRNSYIYSQAPNTGTLIGFLMSGYVADITVKNTYINSSANYTSGIIGMSLGTDLIERCYNYADVNCVGGHSCSGGIVGVAGGYSYVKECFNYGSIKGTSCNGGVVGHIEEAATIRNCGNYGELTGDAGGIYGAAIGQEMVPGNLAIRKDSQTVENCFTVGNSYFGLCAYPTGGGCKVTNCYIVRAKDDGNNSNYISRGNGRFPICNQVYYAQSQLSGYTDGLIPISIDNIKKNSGQSDSLIDILNSNVDNAEINSTLNDGNQWYYWVMDTDVESMSYGYPVLYVNKSFKKPSIDITKQPTTQTVYVGSKTDLSVAAEVLYAGEAIEPDNIAYQWYSNTKNSIKDAVKIEGAVSDTYTVPTDKEGISYYYCSISAEIKGKTLKDNSEIATINVVDSNTAIYRVNFNQNTEDYIVVDNVPDTQTYISDSLVNKPEEIRYIDSDTDITYVCTQWYEDSACTILWDFKINKITKDTVLYAKWTAVDSYSIKYLPGTEDEVTGIPELVANLKAGTTQSISDSNPVRTGYVFAGWTTDNKGVKIIDGKFTMPSSDVVFTATWKTDGNGNGISDDEEETYSVKYLSGTDDKVTGIPKAVSNLLSGSTQSISDSKPVRTGYVFAGWTTDNNDVKVTDEKFTMPSSDVVFTATWKTDGNGNGIADDEEETYTVKYLSGTDDKVTGIPEAVSKILSGSIQSVSDSKPVRTGYIFAGWTIDNKDVKITNGKFTMPSSDVVFTATWKTDANGNGIADDEEDKAEDEETYKISGVVQGDDDKVIKDATIIIVKDDTIIDKTVSDENGKFTLHVKEKGQYIIKIDTINGDNSTINVTIDGKDINLGPVKIQSGKITTKVEVDKEIPEITVEGMDENKSVIVKDNNKGVTAADIEVLENGGSIEMLLEINNPKEADEEKNKIYSFSKDKNIKIGMFLDISVWKNIISLAGEKNSSKLIELPSTVSINILVPEEMRGKSGYVIYRNHEGKVDEITSTPNADGEYIELSKDGKNIKLVTKKFSIYAIGYIDKAEINTNTPTVNSGNNNSKPADSNNAAPQTSDAGNTNWIILLIIGFGSFILSFVFRKKIVNR